MQLFTAKNHSAIINASITDGMIHAGLIVVTPLSPNQLVFSNQTESYFVELPDELVDQGLTSSLVDVDLPFSFVTNS